MSIARIQNHNGQPTIFVDDTPIAPMGMTVPICRPDYLHALGESGIKLYFLMAATDWMQPGSDNERSGFAQFRQDAEALLRAVPDACIMIRILLHPPVEWLAEHPDSIMRYQDGSHQPAILASEISRQLLPGMYTLGSDEWRSAAGIALEQFCQQVDVLPYADRIIGYFLCAGGTSEWYPVNPLEDGARYGDFSPAFQREFSRILKERYGTESALRRAWKDPAARFDRPVIPTPHKRRYHCIDGAILDALHNYENADRELDREIEMNPESAANLGVFVNADTNLPTVDFYHAWSRATANSIIYFARQLKKRRPHQLVGAFYGSYGCTDYYDASTAQAVLPILDSGFVDFLAAPGCYDNREPGGYVAQREMQDSFRLRNQIFIAEEDSRTHLENDFYRDAMGLYDIQDTITTLKRDFSRNLCEETYAWWFDQHKDGGRYQHPEIYRLFARQQEVARKALSFDRTKKNEIALIFDQESLHYISAGTNRTMLDHYRSAELSRIGAPADYYFHDDMARADMPDYKLYVMVNLFCLNEEERTAIQEKAARNHAAVVWLYAPGFIDPEKDVRMSNDYITQLTGFEVERLDDTVSPRFKITQPHPALRYADPYRRYGYIDRDVHSNVWLGSSLTPPFVNPCFCIRENGAEILGRYLINGKGALAIREYKGFTSVYCAAPILRAELIASLAEYSGCHLFTHTDDCLYANENFVSIHSNHSGERTLFFKRACHPFEIYEKRFYGHNVTQITIDLNPGDTRTFCISDQMGLDGI